MKQQLYLKLPNRGRCALAVFCLMFILPFVVGISVAQTTTGGEAGQTTESSTVETRIWDMKRWSPYWVGIGIRITATY